MSHHRPRTHVGSLETGTPNTLRGVLRKIKYLNLSMPQRSAPAGLQQTMCRKLTLALISTLRCFDDVSHDPSSYKAYFSLEIMC